MKEEIVEALIGQRKRLEMEKNGLKEGLAKAAGKEREKILKSIKDIESQISKLNTRVSGLKSGKDIIPERYPPHM